MQIRYVISVTAHPDKGGEAVRELGEMAQYISKKYSVPIEVLSSMDGPGRIHWVASHKSLAELEQVLQAWESDPKNKEWNGKFPKLFDPLKSETHMYSVAATGAP